MNSRLAEAVCDTADGVMLAVRVTPRASKSKITGLYAEGNDMRIKISVAAPPVDGKSNEALLAFVAEALGVAGTAVTLVAGHTSRSKRLRVAGLTAAQSFALLAPAVS